MKNASLSYITCPACGHNGNLSSRKTCEVCGQTLQRNLFANPLLILAIVLATVTLLLGGALLLIKEQPASVKDQPDSSTASQLGLGNSRSRALLSQISNVPAGIFNYGGSTTFAPLRSASVLQAIEAAHPNFTLRYTEPIGKNPGSGSGIAMLINGQLSFSQSSRPLKDQELEKAEKRGYRIEQVPIAIDGIAVYVNPALNIQKLTVPQLRDIFTGKFTNWSLLGGPNLPIKAFSRDPQAGGTVDFFIDQVLEQKKLASAIKIVRDTTEGIRLTSKTPGGIGYASASEVVTQSKIKPLSIALNANKTFVAPFSQAGGKKINYAAFANGSYPITRRLFVVIKRDGALDEQAGRAYVNMMLSDEGQKLIRQNGFVPIKGNVQIQD